MTIYDLEHVYDDRIAPLMEQILTICEEHQLPMFATFQYARSAETGAAFCTSSLPCEAERGPSPELLAALRAVRPVQPVSAFKLTTTHADGSQSVEHVVVVGNGTR